MVAWDVVAEDWRDDPAELLVQRVMRRLRRGSIVLFHDTLYATEDARYRDRAPMRQALEILLGRLAGDYPLRHGARAAAPGPAGALAGRSTGCR